jgi:hypothetical protein
MSNKPIPNYPGLAQPKNYKLNPKSNNWVYCPDPKVINPLTGRCVEPNSKTLSKAVEVSYSDKKKQGYKLNPKSNNWIFCPDPKVINPATGRCVEPKSKVLTKTVVDVSYFDTLKNKKSPVKKDSKSKEILKQIIKDLMYEKSKKAKKRKTV